MYHHANQNHAGSEATATWGLRGSPPQNHDGRPGELAPASEQGRPEVVELLHRYSNYGFLVKPLVRLLEEINSDGLDCNKAVTSRQDDSAYSEAAELQDPEARNTFRDVAKTVRQKQHRLAHEEITQLIARYQAGTLVKDLAIEFEVERRTVSGILRREGVKLRRRGLIPEQIDEAVRLYGQGWSLARIGEKLGVTANTVRARLLEAGVQMRDTQGRER